MLPADPVASLDDIPAGEYVVQALQPVAHHVLEHGAGRAGAGPAITDEPEWRNGRRNGLKHRRAMPVRVRVPPPAFA